MKVKEKECTASALHRLQTHVKKPDTRAFFDLQQHPDGQIFPGLSIVRFDGGLFFVNADALGDRLRDVRVHADPPLNGVILSMEGVNFMDAEGADAVKKIAQAGIDQGVDLHLARVKPQVMEVLDRDEVIDLIGAEHIHDDIAAAVELHLKKHPSETTDSQAAPDSQPAVT